MTVPIFANTSCITTGNGDNCGISSYTSPDGAVTTTYSGEGCDCTTDPGQCVEQPDQPAINPDEPCIQEGSVITCLVNPNDHCDASGQCEPNCGEINGQFVCVSSENECAAAADCTVPPPPDTPPGDNTCQPGDPNCTPPPGDNTCQPGDLNCVPVPTDEPCPIDSTDCYQAPTVVPCSPGSACDSSSLYEKNDWEARNFGTVLTDFKADILATPVGQVSNNFFSVHVGVANCPTWRVDTWVFHFDIDQFCSPIMSSIWVLIRAVLLAAASFLAFRWAFL